MIIIQDSLDMMFGDAYNALCASQSSNGTCSNNRICQGNETCQGNGICNGDCNGEST